MSREFDVVIVGAGVVGVVTACLLVERKLCAPARVAVLADPLPEAAEAADAAPGWDLRVFALSRASERVLRCCAIWQRLPPRRRFAYERMCVWDSSGTPGGRGSIRFDSAALGEPDLGSIVDARALQAHSAAAARAAGIVLIEAGLAELTVGESEARLGLTDGRQLRCTLVVAADGTESRTRGLLGVATAGHAYDQDALVAHVRTEKPHAATAWQRFLSTGPVALLPLTDSLSSVVWSVARAEAARLRALTPQEFGTALTEATGAVLGRCELVTAIASFPLKLQYAERYVTAHGALLGDAAHVVHPLAGQGLNLGLADGAALVDVLSGAGRPRAFGDPRVLRRYERWRRSENMLAATVLDGLERLFTNSNPGLRALRSSALGRIDRLPMLKHAFARRALGLSGDVPAFVSEPVGLRRADEIV